MSTLRRIAAAQPLLFRSGVALLVVAALCAIGLVTDARTINGVNVWIKPIKFQVSIGVYLMTLAAYFLALPAGADRTRAGRYVVWTSLVAGLFEALYITIQAARGEASHFNLSSPFTIAMYALMGIGALLLTSGALVQGPDDRPAPESRACIPRLRMALVIGLVTTFVLGAGFGAYMSSGTGHWVGGTHSDAGGLALFEWSRDGGDLRVAHFFGIHAMHFVPAFAWIALRLLRERTAMIFTATFAAVFAAFTVATFVQAVTGRPFLA